MKVTVVASAEEVERALGSAERVIRPGVSAMLRSLAIQAVRAAEKRARGPGTAKPGAYPIPIRTGTFRRGFGFEANDQRSIAFNTSAYAGALHAGFKPYGNVHARPIPARPYFDDAQDDLDIDAAAAELRKRMEAAP